MKTRVRVSREEFEKGLNMQLKGCIRGGLVGHESTTFWEGNLLPAYIELEAEVIEEKSDEELLIDYANKLVGEVGGRIKMLCIGLAGSNAINPEFLARLRSEQK